MNSALPFWGAFGIAVIAGIFAFMREFLKKRLVLIFLMLAISVIVMIGIHQFRTLRDLNDFSKVNIFKDDEWNEFIKKFGVSSSTKINWRTFDGQGLTSGDGFGQMTEYVNLQKAIDEGYKVINIWGDGVFSTSQDDISSFRVFELADHPEEIDKIMQTHNILMEDKIAVYCADGGLARITSAILNLRGYDTKWASFFDISDLSVLNDPNQKNKVKNDLVIMKTSLEKNEKYLYPIFFKRDMDFLIQNADLFKEISDHLVILINHPTCLWAKGTLTEDKNIYPLIKDKIHEIHSDHNIHFADYRIICWDKLHCYNTKVFLMDEIAKGDIKKIYLL